MNNTFFQWKEEYSVKVQQIDDQHMAIIDMLNDLYNAFMKKEHEDKTGEILYRLAIYASMHFKTEEKYFSRFNYEHTAAHLSEHAVFIKQVNNFKTEYARDKSALTYRVINFLKEWLTNHIMISDKKYIHCFVSNGLK